MKRSFIFVTAFFLLFLTAMYFAFSQEELPEPIWVYYGRGNRYFHDQKLGYAMAEYKKALSKIDNKLKITGKTDQYLPDVCLKIAKIYFLEGLFDVSLFYTDIAQKNSNLFQIPDRLFSVLYLESENYYKLNKINKVIELYNRIINKDNNWKNYKSLRADEIPDFILSEEKKIKFGPAYFNLGKIKYDNGNYDNAIVYLRMSFLYGYKINDSSNLLKNCYRKLGMIFMEEKINKMISKIHRKE